MKPSILITGVNGFVGHHAAKLFHGSGYTVIGVGQDAAVSDSNKAYVDSYHACDLLSASDVSQLPLAEVGMILHLAGLAAVGPSFDRPLQYITANIGMQINLFEAALAQSAQPRTLIVSSGSLYDSKTALPITESSAVLPSSPYAVSKLGQEQMGMYYANRGFEVLIARPFNHIGPGQLPGFLLPDLVSQAIACERGVADHISVGNLDAKRDYTDVRDIVRAYQLLLEQGQPGHIYNVCSGRSYSGHQVLDRIITRSKQAVDVQIDQTRMRPSDAPDIYGSHDTLSADTGWQPSIDLDSSIDDIMNDWRSRADS